MTDPMSDQFRAALMPLVIKHVEAEEAQRIQQAIEKRLSLTVMQPESDGRKER